MRKHDHELQHLRLGDVPLPRALDLERGHQVVAVHDDVDARVYGPIHQTEIFDVKGSTSVSNGAPSCWEKRPF
jgi:hypothetical protein